MSKGINAIGALLGNGMYNVPATTRYTKFVAENAFGPRALFAELHFEFSDGTSLVLKSVVLKLYDFLKLVNTDSTWTSQKGPLTYSHTYGGIVCVSVLLLFYVLFQNFVKF